MTIVALMTIALLVAATGSVLVSERSTAPRADSEDLVRTADVMDTATDGLTDTWDTCTQPIVYRTTATGDRLLLVDEAVAILSAATGFEFVRVQPPAARLSSSDDGLVIGFVDESNGIFDDADEAVGIARVRTVNGRIVGATVGIRTDQGLREEFGSGPTMGSALLHELGHAFGLPHSTEVRSIMYPNLNVDQGPGYSRGDLVALSQVAVNAGDCVLAESSGG